MKALDSRLAQIEHAAMRRMGEVIDLEIDAMPPEEKQRWLAQIDKSDLSSAHPLLCTILAKHNLLRTFERLKYRPIPEDLL